ncbi:MAG: hypothetical protein ABIH42_05245, partial [Planctomycetota bacterium]
AGFGQANTDGSSTTYPFGNKPVEWDKLGRNAKAEFLLKGSTNKSGVSDINSLFYAYRSDAVKRFCVSAVNKIKAVRPKAAVFICVFPNHVASERLVGQNWKALAPFIDGAIIEVPDSNAKFNENAFINLIKNVVSFSTDLCHVYFKIDIDNIYSEKLTSLVEIINILTNIESGKAKDIRFETDRINIEFDKVKVPLASTDPMLTVELVSAFKKLPEVVVNKEQSKIFINDLKTKIIQLLKTPPVDLCPPDKLTGIINNARSKGAQGFFVIGAAEVTGKNLWKPLEQSFIEGSIEPYIANPIFLFMTDAKGVISEETEERIKLLSDSLRAVTKEFVELSKKMETPRSEEMITQIDNTSKTLQALAISYKERITQMEQEINKAMANPDPESSSSLSWAHYEYLKRRLKSIQERLDIAERQVRAGQDWVLLLKTEWESAEETLVQQKQEHLFFTTVAIGLACLALTATLLFTLIRKRG